MVFNMTLNQWALMANSTDVMFDTFNGTSPLNNPGPTEEAFALMNNWGDYWVFNNDQEYGDLWLIGMKKKQLTKHIICFLLMIFTCRWRWMPL